MEQGRSRHHAGEDALDCVDAYIRLEITERAVGENQPNVKTNQRATAPEEKAHKTPNRTVFLDPVAIIDPNQGKVLDIVKYFEQCNTDENACHDVVAVPPKRNARDEKHELYRMGSLPADPHPDKISHK